jgi:flagellar FliJ protein
MAQPFSLQRLLDIAASEVETAAASLGDLNHQLQLQEQKLTLLLQYHADYQARLRRAVANGLNSGGLRNFNDFIARLDQAIRQQRAAVDEARGRAGQGRDHWQTKRLKAKAFDTLSVRFTTKSTRIESSREQKSQDDFASRGARYKSLEQR